jgi:hypothetical protein
MFGKPGWHFTAEEGNRPLFWPLFGRGRHRAQSSRQANARGGAVA